MNLLEPIQPHTTGGRIFEAAARLFQERGYKKVTISDITAAAGVGKGTLYLYWPSKQDLTLALIASDMIRTMTQLREALATDPRIAMPSQIALFLLEAARQRPVLATFNTDPAIVGVMEQRPESYEILRNTSFLPLLSAALPKMRELGLISHQLSVQEQIFSCHTLMLGAISIAEEPQFLMTSILHQQMPEIYDLSFLTRSFEVLLGETTEGKEKELEEYGQWFTHLIDDYIQRLSKVLYPRAAQEGTITTP